MEYTPLETCLDSIWVLKILTSQIEFIEGRQDVKDIICAKIENDVDNLIIEIRQMLSKIDMEGDK